MINRNNLWAIVLSLIVVGCVPHIDEGTVPTARPTSPPVVVVIRTPGTPAPTSIPEPTSTPYSVNGTSLRLDPNSGFFPQSIRLTMKQQLVVVPLASWGEGWDVTFDPQFLQLDPVIDLKYPPETGWMWTPRQSGQTNLGIESIVPCRNFNPPCGMPIIIFMLNITITE